jgi:DNA polymerase V
MDNLQTLADSNDGVSIHTGFPNPALDHAAQGPRLALDINQLLVQHPSRTYLFRIAGHRWSDDGIYDGDVAVIVRGRRHGARDLVATWQDDSFQLKRHAQLTPDDSVWGVITAVIHQYG